MRLYYSRKRNEILDLIQNSRFSEKCHVIENSSGLHFLLKLDTKISDEEVIRYLKEKGMRIRALSDYYLDGDRTSRHMFILDYSNLDIGELKKLIS